jgi:hypothetical protein
MNYTTLTEDIKRIKNISPFFIIPDNLVFNLWMFSINILTPISPSPTNAGKTKYKCLHPSYNVDFEMIINKIGTKSQINKL